MAGCEDPEAQEVLNDVLAILADEKTFEPTSDVDGKNAARSNHMRGLKRGW